MKTSGKTTGHNARKNSVVALALTWDGARWPTRSLPPTARAFLSAKRNTAIPARQKLAALFVADEVNEVRVCWIPRLKGGPDVLSEPFPAPSGKRIHFQSTAMKQFGDILGIIYRRRSLAS